MNKDQSSGMEKKASGTANKSQEQSGKSADNKSQQTKSPGQNQHEQGDVKEGYKESKMKK